MAAVGLVVSLAAFQASRSSGDRAANLRFDSVASQVAVRVDDEMGRYVDLLRGVEGLYAGSEVVTVEEFQAYVASLDIEQRYPGARAVAVVSPVGRTTPIADAVVIAAEPAPNPLLSPGTRPTDIAGLAPTLERAAARSGPALSDIVDPGDGDTAAHFFMALPVPHDVVNGAVTVWVDGDTFLSGLLLDQPDELGLAVVEHDTARPSASTLVASDRTDGPPAVGREIPLDVLDRRWLVTVSSTQSMRTAGERSQPWIVLGTGLSLTLAVALLTAVQGWARSRSLALLERAERSEARSERLLDIAPVAIVELARSGEVLRWNGAASELFGRTPADVVGHRLRVTVEHDGNDVDLVDLVNDDGRGPRVGPAGTIRVVVPRLVPDSVDRREVVVFSTASDDRDERQLVVLVDETEHARLVQRLGDAQKLDLVGRLAGGVAHDFNNFLTAIRGYVELVLGDESLAPEHRAALTQSVSASGRAAAVVAQLLAVSRHQVYRPEVVDVGQHITSPDSLLRTLVTSDVTLAVDVAASDWPPNVRIDPTRLEQVLLNLAINARDAVDGHGHIDVTVRSDREHVTIAVADDGHGMPPHVRDHVFEPFFSTKGPASGTGLGLPTVRSIVTEAGGRIDLETAEGSGTTFTITFPRAPGPVSAARSTPTPAASPRSDGAVAVLVVDDDEDVRTLVTKILAVDGHEILEAVDADSAVDRVERHRGRVAEGTASPLALVLTDVVLPGVSGPELVERLRSLGEQAPVIFMSGYAHGMLTGDGELPPGTRFIGKPFSVAELRNAVDSVLAERDRA